MFKLLSRARLCKELRLCPAVGKINQSISGT